MPASWPEYTLKEVCIRITDGAHQSPKSVDIGLPMASVKDLTPFGINMETCRKISEHDFKELVRQDCQPRVGDVLIAKDGATALDTVCEIRQSLNVVLLSSVAILRPDSNKIYPGFLRYYMDCDTTREYLKNGFITGAAIPRVVLEDFKRAKIKLPPLSIQRKIAAILSAYDDLIENNTRRIKILEEMAQSLYREWFVRLRFPGHEKVPKVDSPLGRIPEGWEVKTFGEVALNFDSRRKPLSSMQRSQRRGEYPYYGAAKILDYIDDFIFYGKYLLVAEDGSVITPNGKPVLQLVNAKFWVNNHTHIIQGKTPMSTEFLYYRLLDLEISGYITGAAQPKITQANLNRIPIVVPTKQILLRFNEIAENCVSKSINLQRRSENLRRTRDFLLPKFISGELNVENLEIKVEGINS